MCSLSVALSLKDQPKYLNLLTRSIFLPSHFHSFYSLFLFFLFNTIIFGFSIFTCSFFFLACFPRLFIISFISLSLFAAITKSSFFYVPVIRLFLALSHIFKHFLCVYLVKRRPGDYEQCIHPPPFFFNSFIVKWSRMYTLSTVPLPFLNPVSLSGTTPFSSIYFFILSLGRTSMGE
jgi:hypothetical protein